MCVKERVMDKGSEYKEMLNNKFNYTFILNQEYILKTYLHIEQV